jgi:hypothetical protein
MKGDMDLGWGTNRTRGMDERKTVSTDKQSSNMLLMAGSIYSYSWGQLHTYTGALVDDDDDDNIRQKD